MGKHILKLKEEIKRLSQHDITFEMMLDSEDEERMGLFGRDPILQVTRLCSGYNDLKEEYEKLKKFVRDVAYNFDCDVDGHKHGKYCRSCDAARLLGEPNEGDYKSTSEVE